MFVPFHSVYSSSHRFKNQITSITSQFPPGVSGVCTEPKKHLQSLSPFVTSYNWGLLFELFMSSSLYLWVFLVEFLVSTEVVISEVAALSMLTNQHHPGEFSAVTVWGDLILKLSFYLSHLFWDLFSLFFKFGRFFFFHM